MAIWVLSARPSALTPVAARPVPASTDSVVPGGSLKSPAVGASAPLGPIPTISQHSQTGPVRTSEVIVIDVAGRVQRPGVYRLPIGARVDDAIRAAGGPKVGVDLSRINLARRLVDGEQVAVAVVGDSTASGADATAGADGAATTGGANTGGANTSGANTSGANTGGANTGGLLDLNRATAAQLDALPGVGPVLAKRIIDFRLAHQRFDAVEQLRGVSGIGDAKFADLKAMVTVS